MRHWHRTSKSALGLALIMNVVVACGDDGETSNPSSGGNAGKGGSGGTATAGANASGAVAGQGDDPQVGAGGTGGTDPGTGDAGGAGDAGGTGSGGAGGTGGFSGSSGGGGEGSGDAEVPLEGFGEIAGDCGVIDAALLAGVEPAIFRASFTFPDEDYMISDLSVGGVEISAANINSGSSLESEVFAYEYLYRCELAEMLKTEEEVQYLLTDFKVDVLTRVDGEPLGVSAVRAVKFPFNEPYSAADAKAMLESKLVDLLHASLNVSDEDLWKKPVLVVMAYSEAHADAVEEAYETLDEVTKSDTLVFVVVTEGDDAFLYE